MYRILWAEDDTAYFENVYRKTLDTFLNARGVEYEATHAVDGNEVFRHLTTGGSFDLLVVDVNMPNWNGIQTARDISVRFEGLPIIVVSAKVHDAEFRELLDLLVAEEVLRGYFFSLDSEQWCEAIVGALESGPITILHFSDLHFGRFHGLTKATVSLEDLICAQFGKIIESPRVDLLVVSGDFGSEGFLNEFDQAAEFLTRIAGQFSIPRDRIIFVPGNHDIYRHEEDGQRFNKYVKFVNSFYADSKVSLARYRELFDPRTGRLREDGVEPDSLAGLSIFDDLRLVVVGLNSVISRKEDWDYGEIKGSQLFKMQTALEELNPPRSDFFRMAVFHHHLFEVPTIYEPDKVDRVVSNQGLILRHLIRQKIRLILHGHSHYGAGYRYVPYFFEESPRPTEPIFVFSTGTLGGAHKTSPQYSYQCNMLRLFRKDRSVTHGVVTPLRLMDDSLEWRTLAPIHLDLAV